MEADNIFQPNFRNIIFTPIAMILVTQNGSWGHLKFWHFLGWTPYYKYVLCTFIHQKVRHDFGSIDLDHKPQEAKQAPRRDPSPWYCIRIMLTVTARYMIRSLQRHSGLFKQQGLGIEVGLLLGSLYITGLYNCLTAGFHEKNLIL